MKKKKNQIDGSFTALENKLTDSAPWKDMSISSRYLFFELKKRFKGDNRERIILTYREAKEFMSINTFIKSRNKLIENGFIDVIKRGSLWGQKAVFALSDRWKSWGTKDFVKVEIKETLPEFYRKK